MARGTEEQIQAAVQAEIEALELCIKANEKCLQFAGNNDKKIRKLNQSIIDATVQIRHLKSGDWRMIEEQKQKNRKIRW